MTIKLRVKRYNLRRADPAAATSTAPVQPALRAARSAKSAVAAMSANRPAPPVVDDGFGDAPFPTASDQVVAMMAAGSQSAAAPADLDQIRQEGLTGRQLRMARRMAQKYGLPATSDFDAVRLLRAAGIDPFQKSTIIQMITADEADSPEAPPSTAMAVSPRGDGVRLPQTIKPIKVPSTEVRAEDSHLSDLQRIQRDLAKRRRRKSALLTARLFFFVFLPTLLAGWYYYGVATPLYATKAEFVIQQADPAGTQGMGGLLSGTQFATSQDSIAVQGYLQSRDAMLRLDADKGFIAHFSDPAIDPIQRLPEGATREDAYKIYKRNVKISYDPTEGIIKMEVIAANPEVSAAFSTALIGYAEEQVDHLTQRLREDQMRGARESYELAEAAMMAAQRRVVELQEQFKVLSSEVEVGLITTQIGQLETQLSTERLGLAQMESNARPNPARMEPVKRRIATLEREIATLRSRLTEGQNGGQSLAQVQSELLMAQTDVQTRQLLLAQSLQSMETARTDANRQVRYLSLSVSPTPPDEAAYPRAFENTMVALLVFAGIYLMLSMTAAILREQVSA
ncbi:MAG: capsule biosynthesis protein [Rhodobacteraceae bacterium]|nr:capsule biosynthesis protein [Paracoccaceae bacterium]